MDRPRRQVKNTEDETSVFLATKALRHEKLRIISHEWTHFAEFTLSATKCGKFRIVVILYILPQSCDRRESRDWADRRRNPDHRVGITKRRGAKRRAKNAKAPSRWVYRKRNIIAVRNKRSLFVTSCLRGKTAFVVSWLSCSSDANNGVCERLSGRHSQRYGVRHSQFTFRLFLRNPYKWKGSVKDFSHFIFFILAKDVFMAKNSKSRRFPCIQCILG